MVKLDAVLFDLTAPTLGSKACASRPATEVDAGTAWTPGSTSTGTGTGPGRGGGGSSSSTSRVRSSTASSFTTATAATTTTTTSSSSNSNKHSSRGGRGSATATSFFLDCTIAAQGPDGMTGRTKCPNGPRTALGAFKQLLKKTFTSRAKKCRPVHEECSRLQRALTNKISLTDPQNPVSFCKKGELLYVHFANGNDWQRCCILGDQNAEKAQCEAMFERFDEPPPVVEKPRLDPQTPKRMVDFQATLRTTQSIEKATLATDQLICPAGGRTGDYPPGVVLEGAFGPGTKVCLNPGLPGELFPGGVGYKVIYMQMPPELLPLLLLKQQGLGSERPASPVAVNDFL